MSYKHFMKIALLGLVAGSWPFINDLGAWQRKAMDECKQDAKECTKNPDRCHRDSDKCKSNVFDNDAYSFALELTDYDKGLFSKFTMDQKKLAMDLADRNKMSPGDAVSKIAGTW